MQIARAYVQCGVRLPNKFQRKLNDTVIHLSRSELTEQSVRRSIRIERAKVTGRRKVGVIQGCCQLSSIQPESA